MSLKTIEDKLTLGKLISVSDDTIGAITRFGQVMGWLARHSLARCHGKRKRLKG